GSVSAGGGLADRGTVASCRLCRQLLRTHIGHRQFIGRSCSIGRIAELYPQCVKPQLTAPCLHCPMSCCSPSECVAPEHGAIGTGDLEDDLAISRQPGQAED